MNNSELKRIEERLVPPAAPDPPPELWERIQAEIPEYLSVVDEAPRAISSAWRVRLLAASALLAVVTGVVVYRVTRQAPSVEDWVDREVVAGGPVVVETPQREQAGEVPPPDKLEASQDEQLGRASGARLERVEIEVEPPSVAGPRSAAGEGGLADGRREKKRQDELVPTARQRVVTEVPPVGEDAATMDRPAERDLARSVDREAENRAAPTAHDAAPSQKESAASVAAEAPRFVYEEPLPVRQETESGDAVARTERPKAPPAREQMVLRDQGPAAPSTGGAAEPNEAPYGDMFFRGYGTNPFVDTEDDRFSTFGLDVDTGSFGLVRSYLERGHLPPADAVRVEELVNYFDYGDPSPRRGEFTVIAEGAPSPFATGPRYQLVRFGIRGREISRSQRRPAVLIFVVDVSGSMRRENRLELVKRSLHLLLDQLDRGDRIGLVVYGSRGEVLLQPTSDLYAIRRAIDRLVPGGSTNAEEGLALAYRQAHAYYRTDAINRVILCSDGVANVGRTGAESILARVRSAAADGIELTTVGFGMGNYNDVLMEQLADQGDGSYAYVDTLEEARRIFVENLTGTLQTIAADAKVQVEFNPKTVSRYRLLGYENRDIADERFRDDTVDAGEIGAGHSVTALYEIKLRENVGRGAQLATLRLRYRSRESDRVAETAVDLRRRNLASSWERGTNSLRLSSLVAEFAEILKGSYWARDADLEDVYRRLLRVGDEMAGTEEVQELVYLVERARRLSSIPSYEFEE